MTKSERLSVYKESTFGHPTTQNLITAAMSQTKQSDMKTSSRKRQKKDMPEELNHKKKKTSLADGIDADGESMSSPCPIKSSEKRHDHSKKRRLKKRG